jgi:hypothetical protein
MKPAKDIITGGIKVLYRPFCLLTIIVFVLVNFQLISSVGASSAVWTQTYGGEDLEYAYSLVETSDGGYAIAGYTDSFGAGESDFWLVKTDASGTLQWSQTYGTDDNDKAYSLIQTHDGGYAMVGYCNIVTQTDGGSYEVSKDFWLVKTDAHGNMEWNRTYGGERYEYAYSLVETSDGGFALAGETDSFGAGEEDFWLVKTDASGNMEWNQTYGGTNYDNAFSLVVTSDGGYAIAGYTASFGAGASDFWLVKTDEHGIIPEFPSWTILPLFLAATVSGILVKKRLFRNRS